jgi:hypothetical protein
MCGEGIGALPRLICPTANLVDRGNSRIRYYRAAALGITFSLCRRAPAAKFKRR